jgi:hypothetical protein
MALHKDLSGTDLHEPKGASSASANTVYVANGAGSGAWSIISPASIGWSLLSVYNSADQTIAISETTANWTSTSSVVGSSLEIVSGNTTRIRALRAGTMLCTFTMAITSAAAPNCCIRIKKNGSTYIAGAVVNIVNPPASASNSITVTTTIPVALNDYIELVGQSSTGPSAWKAVSGAVASSPSTVATVVLF